MLTAMSLFAAYKFEKMGSPLSGFCVMLCTISGLLDFILIVGFATGWK